MLQTAVEAYLDFQNLKEKLSARLTRGYNSGLSLVLSFNFIFHFPNIKTLYNPIIVVSILFSIIPILP